MKSENRNGIENGIKCPKGDWKGTTGFKTGRKWYRATIGLPQEWCRSGIKTGRKVTKDEVERWLNLKERGYTDRAIAEKYHRDKKTIAKYLKPSLEGKRGQGSPQDQPDSELETLKKLEEKEKLLMALEAAREARMKIPERLDKVETTLKAIMEDLENQRLRLNSQPDFSQWRKCSQCGKPYMMIKAECGDCGHEFWYHF